MRKSDQSLYQWRKRFGTMNADDAKWLKQLEVKNSTLKKMLADRLLEIEVMKEIAGKMVDAPVLRRQVAYAKKRGLSLSRRNDERPASPDSSSPTGVDLVPTGPGSCRWGAPLPRWSPAARRRPRSRTTNP